MLIFITINFSITMLVFSIGKNLPNVKSSQRKMPGLQEKCMKGETLLAVEDEFVVVRRYVHLPTSAVCSSTGCEYALATIRASGKLTNDGVACRRIKSETCVTLKNRPQFDAIVMLVCFKSCLRAT